MKSVRGRRRSVWLHRRAAVATLDYILVLGVILPLAAIVIPQGIRIMRLVYEMTCVLIAWPFM